MDTKRRKIGFFFVFWILAIFALPIAQDVATLQQKLARIEKEIQDLEQQLASTNKKLRTESAFLDKLDQQISLIHRKALIYRQAVEEKNRRIQQLEAQIDSLQRKKRKLQAVFEREVRFAYKYQRGKHLDWILGARNFHAALIRQRYFQLATAAEKKNYQRLMRLNEELRSRKAKLAAEVEAVQKLLAELNQEENRLKKQRRFKTQLVQKIVRNKKLLAQSLQNKKRSFEKLKKLLASLEKERPQRRYETKTKIKWEKLTGSFARNKGRLNWPVQGTILHKFGRYRNPRLKTVLNNTGIDIRAKLGTQVRCVFSGVVSLITYISGFGNTIIIDHNDGYYTVYSHLDQVLVGRDEFVEGGTVIGTVGESGSLEGPKLHFEIYGNNKPLNPLKWLSKK